MNKDEYTRRSRARWNARRLHMSLEAYLKKRETHRRCDGGGKGAPHWARYDEFRSEHIRTCSRDVHEETGDMPRTATKKKATNAPKATKKKANIGEPEARAWHDATGSRLGGPMPGPVSDSYDPEFGTATNADDVREAIDHVRGKITRRLGEKLAPIVTVAQCVLGDFEGSSQPKLVPFTEEELRVIRFCLDRAKETI